MKIDFEAAVWTAVTLAGITMLILLGALWPPMFFIYFLLIAAACLIGGTYLIITLILEERRSYMRPRTRIRRDHQ
jgi:hypothetical protein